jgi:hypothetical protein
MLLLVLLIAATPAGAAEPGASHKTVNFIVTAATAEVARQVAVAAEAERTAAARRWFGKEPGAWDRPCTIRVTLEVGPSGGATSFDFAPVSGEKPQVAFAVMNLRGDLRQLLASTLPHEMTHLVFAHHFGRALPRWADEGVALLAESAPDQEAHDARCRDLLNEGRGLRLHVLIRMMDYPKDMMATYTQGHSLVRFLTSGRGDAGQEDSPEAVLPAGMTRFVQFLEAGTTGNTAASWDRAAKDLYGYGSIDALEESWLTWLRKKDSVLNRRAASKSIAPLVKPAASELIPPIELPGSGQPARPEKE